MIELPVEDVVSLRQFMIIADFEAFEGEHCETVAIGNLLKHQGLDLSEPMLFGIGSGLGFIYWKMKTMPLPFLGGRSKVLTATICEHLSIQMQEQQTTSPAKAWQNVVSCLDRNVPVALQLDCYHLEYFTKKIHFAGHHVAMYGYDSEKAYLVDTRQQGSKVTTKRENLAKARSEKGPMSARNRSVSVSFEPGNVDIDSAIIRGIKRNAAEFLNPPIQNIGYKGISKTAKEIKKWFATSSDIQNDFTHSAVMMEKAGTGGALFRNLYRDFLRESHDRLGYDWFKEGAERYAEIAKDWTEVSRLFLQVAETQSEEPLASASALLETLAIRERDAMQQLNIGVNGL